MHIGVKITSPPHFKLMLHNKPSFDKAPHSNFAKQYRVIFKYQHYIICPSLTHFQLFIQLHFLSLSFFCNFEEFFWKLFQSKLHQQLQ